MVRLFLVGWMFLGVCFAQTEQPIATDGFKKEATKLADDVEKVVGSVIPNTRPFQGAKATYLDGYGLLVTMETALEPPRNMFSTAKSPAEMRTTMNQRLSDLQQGLQKLLKENAGGLHSLADTESITIVLYITNFNPDVTNFPSQVVLTVKKDDPGHVITRTP